MDMGLAIEDSEGGDGILNLTVKRKGASIKVAIQLEKLGRFADTFPENCKKTDTLKKRAYSYLLKNSDGISSQGRCVTILSMLSSDDPKVFTEGKRLAKAWNRVPGTDTWTWHLGFQGITLAEYYLITQDKSVLPTLETLSDMLRKAQYKGPNIYKWKAKAGESQELINKHTQLYDGGFGHGPFKNAPGGYGPMQRPTYLAILAWQLMKQCGIKLKHEGIEKAYTFVDYGTNQAGLTAYGGEFTLNNGPIDPVKWRSSTHNGCSHKSGMAYVMYKLSPERKESEKRMDLHLSNIDVAYRDMCDGHACPLMGLIWGWTGVFASEDVALKKKIFDYYKAWINMARCHGSDSYVVLPGRNYADESYHRGNIRNHTTGSIAFLYSFSNPKLQVQGVNMSIPGVNHLALTGAPAVAYKLITTKAYGAAAKKLLSLEESKNPESPAGKMVGFIDQIAGSEIERLKGQLDSGDWYTLNSELSKAGKVYGGIPSFDKSSGKWKQLLKSKPGKAIVYAGQTASKGAIGKASVDLSNLIKSTTEAAYTGPAKSYKKLLDGKTSVLVKELEGHYKKGEWSLLKSRLVKDGKNYAGNPEFDKKSSEWQTSLKSADGGELVKAHALFLTKIYGQSLAKAKALSSCDDPLVAASAKKLASGIEKGVERYVRECDDMMAKGQWYELKTKLAKNRKRLQGVPVFDKNFQIWYKDLESPAGKAILASEKLLQKGRIGSASKALSVVGTDKTATATATEAAKCIRSRIDQMGQGQLALLITMELAGDWYSLKKELPKVKILLGGLPSFEDKQAEWKKALKTKEVKKAVSGGEEFQRVEAKWQKKQGKRERKALETFITKYDNTFYAKKVADMLSKAEE